MDDKKLRVAVQIYGHLRTFKECFPALKENLLDRYDCDVFIHTWDTLDHMTKAWHGLNEGKEVVSIDAGLKTQISELYKPKAIVIEKQEIQDFGNVTSNGQTYSIFGIKCMLHTMSSVDRLRIDYQKENDIKYDFVLCTRPDIFFKKIFSIESFISKFSEAELQETIFVTGCQYSSILNDIRYFGGKDLLYFAHPCLISNLYLNIEKSFEDVKNVNKQPELLSILEYYFYKLLMHSNFKIQFCNFILGTDYDIKRLYRENKVSIKLPESAPEQSPVAAQDVPFLVEPVRLSQIKFLQRAVIFLPVPIKKMIKKILFIGG